jgi:hypothetical protein
LPAPHPAKHVGADCRVVHVAGHLAACELGDGVGESPACGVNVHLRNTSVITVLT